MFAGIHCGFFLTENDADGCGSFTTVERSMSDRLLKKGTFAMQWREVGREIGIGVGVFLLLTILPMTPVRSVFAETETVTVDIPPQELSTALTALAEQTSLQVLYASELASSQMTKGVAGTFTPQEVIRQLLEGSGLEFTFTDAKTVTLQKAPVPVRTNHAEAVGPSEPLVKQKPIKVPEVVVKDVRERDDAKPMSQKKPARRRELIRRFAMRHSRFRSLRGK